MIGSLRAELLIMRKRASTWILLGIWATLALVFAYAVPYAQYLNGSSQAPLQDVLPESLVGALMQGFPFFGGVLALMLGVLAFGSEYGWGTLKTLFTQRPGRLPVFGAKLLALAAALVVFVLLVFALGALAGSALALREGADIAWPSPSLLIRGLAAGWLILAVWAAFGVLLAVIARGTALATGIGILYALVIEGLSAPSRAKSAYSTISSNSSCARTATRSSSRWAFPPPRSGTPGPGRSRDPSSTAVKRCSSSARTALPSSCSRDGFSAVATSHDEGRSGCLSKTI
jgi:ABC-2 type transport system permease protein